MQIAEYIDKVRAVHKTGAATEHSYRPALEFLLRSIDKNVIPLNEPKKVKCGAPDFIVTRGVVPVGHVEAKDLGIDLKKMSSSNAEQKSRYLKALPNLIYTNCLDFELYREGELVKQVALAPKGLAAGIDKEALVELENLLTAFAQEKLQTITSPKRLAEIMAGKAVLIKDVLGKTLATDDDETTELYGQFLSFREHLIHDINLEDFADIYAETIVYGMFAARLHDETPATFTRQEALELLPKSNPFLRHLFTYVAGPNLDERIRWIIDDLAEAFGACDVKKLLANFGKFVQKDDPFIHFYERFLTEYNPSKRRMRGVWYTPEAVVNFMVRAVDHALKTSFDLPLGLADTSKIQVDWDTGQKKTTKTGKLAKSSKNQVETKSVHKVQVLDPATGTGTFLSEVVKQIAPTVQGLSQSAWSGYVEKDLIPRVHGFELLMASYAMCHMKLDMVITSLGYSPSAGAPRMGVYLTNSLEEGEPVNQTLPFAQWLSNEAKAANAVKRDYPIMCVLGNPPYYAQSKNKAPWIMNLMEDYKKEPGTNKKLMERNPKWINNDYVKFYRLAESLIEKTGEGIVCYISPNGVLDNPTFRGMRWKLLNTFDEIHILDLHGNSNVKEAVPDGVNDMNVFDIMEAVCIMLLVKNNKKKSGALARVYFDEIYGSREIKYEYLLNSDFTSGDVIELAPVAPYYFFRKYDNQFESEYNRGFPLDELFLKYSTGYYTSCDDVVIADTPEQLKLNIGSAFDKAYVKKTTFRPFDDKYVYYKPDMLTRAREKFVSGMPQENIILISGKSTKSDYVSHFFTSNFFSELKCGEATKGSYMFPLYYDDGGFDVTDGKLSGVNLNSKIIKRFEKTTKLSFRAGKSHSTSEFNEVAIFDYVYGILYSDAYRERYLEFLRVNFPRIPYPASKENFLHVAQLGKTLRELHTKQKQLPTLQIALLGVGDNVIGQPKFKNGQIWINKTQHFDVIPEEVWEMQIGGYFPAQKWLKDRKGIVLDFNDIVTYRNILQALAATSSIMAEIEIP